MGFFRRIEQREPLFRGMADRLGVDFGRWISTCPDHAGDYRTAVLSCMACTSEGSCQDWQSRTDRAAQAPNYCRNRRMLDALAKA
ncbi:DUF6455 family protein [Pseudooceanicola sp.]|uniref:DUF6455 family protein n=1 Tax=Pseudooceanicola sp. TaxID=1914328 RepID=UPI0035C75BD4